MLPSIKSLMQIKDVTREQAQQIRTIMAGNGERICYGCRSPFTGNDYSCRHFHDGRHRYSRMAMIDAILQTFGVEHVPPGRNAKSPAFDYCNAGDTYATTILKINGRFRVGCWGDIVERGNYD